MSATKKIDSRSGSAGHPGLEFFTLPPSQVAITRTIEKEILPLNSSNTPPFEFRVFSDSQYVDLSQTYLHLKLSVEKQTAGKWAAITSADKVSLCQSIGTSFVKQLRLQISGNEVYDSTNLYPFLSYIKTELNHTPDYKQTRLSGVGYYQDDYDQDSADNSGHVERMKLCKGGQTFETYGRLDFDLASQQQFLLNNLDILFIIYPADDQHLIKNYDKDDSSQYRLKIHNIKLAVRAVEVQPSVNLAVMKTLQTQPANYSIRKLQIRSCQLTAGRTEITQNIFSSVVPRRLILCMVDNDSYNGSHKKPQFDFQPFGIREIFVNAGGVNYPVNPYNADFEKDQGVVRFFTEMHEACSLGTDTNGIDLERYRSGWTFFVIPLNSTLKDSNGFELIREGVTTIRLQFNKPLEKPVMLLAIGEFDGLLQIDANRLIMMDGTV